MARTITVKGIGKASAKPDYVVLSMTLEAIVGHASEDMTKHYLHVQDSIKEEAVQRFAAAFHVDETHWTE